ncbi:Uma2 family endonuclease [Paenibacillus cremeus]|nr:Uma2 family endonuclease [Paenibacillus cremeus]
MSEKKQLKSSSQIIKEQQEIYDPNDRYEIIDGIRYDLKPSPIIQHQILLTELYSAIRITCNQNGIIVVAPMDVKLDDRNTVQPDLIFIADENVHIIVDGIIQGAPDLLVEILSPSSGSHDKIRKKALYERFGIKEYWIVDPVLHTIDQFAHDGVKLQLHATYGKGDTLKSDRFSCISIDAASLFAAIARF